MMNKPSYLLSACAVIMLVILSGCSLPGTDTSTSTNINPGPNPGVLDPHKQYTVNFWEALDTDANTTALARLVKQYTDAHKNVKINVQSYESSTLGERFNAATAAKQPAIVQVNESWATLYQEIGDIVPLKPYITGKNGLSQSDLSDFYAPLLKDGQEDGKQYTLPFNSSDEVLYYNATLLKKNDMQPPTTLTDFVTDIKKLTKSDGSQWGLSMTPSADEWATIFKDLGGKNFLSSDARSTLFDQGSDAQYAQQALDLFAPLAKTGAIHVTTGSSWQNDFTSQKAAFALGTSASYPFLKAHGGSTFDLNDVAFPGGPAGQFTALYGTKLALFSGVSVDTRNAAWDFMKFLTSTASSISFVPQTGTLPIRQSAYNSPSLQHYYAQNPASRVGLAQIPHTYVASAAFVWKPCSEDITSSYISVLNGHSMAAATVQNMAGVCKADMS